MKAVSIPTISSITFWTTSNGTPFFCAAVYPKFVIESGKSVIGLPEHLRVPRQGIGGVEIAIAIRKKAVQGLLFRRRRIPGQRRPRRQQAKDPINLSIQVVEPDSHRRRVRPERF